MFAFYISSADSVNIPVNAIPLSSQLKYPPHMVSYEENFYNNDNLTLTDFSNTAANQPSSNYFRTANGVFMPHIPFFSNCRKFGQQAILYAIVEDERNCDLIDPINVKPINPFTFGDHPISDTCTNI